jgi:hypothetical protein
MWSLKISKNMVERFSAEELVKNCHHNTQHHIALLTGVLDPRVHTTYIHPVPPCAQRMPQGICPGRAVVARPYASLTTTARCVDTVKS